MRTILLSIILLMLLVLVAFADEYVNGYIRSDGTYVQGYSRTSPDNTIRNNYSTQGNINPYTEKQGTVNPNNDKNYPSGVYNPSINGGRSSKPNGVYNPY
ncbi:MAG: hypothetical protein HQK91_12765 [Nitrospirae bacterium]|nr:hypothetical protein [Nitrospirota bacterium]